MAWGMMAVDWETRVDYDRLRNYRLKRAKEQLDQRQIGAYLCFDFNNIRYLTGVHIGEWARDKMHRYALLPRGGEPILFESGSAGAARRLAASPSTSAGSFCRSLCSWKLVAGVRIS